MPSHNSAFLTITGCLSTQTKPSIHQVAAVLLFRMLADATTPVVRATAEDIAAATRLAKGVVYAALRNLVELGQLRPVGSGRRTGEFIVCAFEAHREEPSLSVPGHSQGEETVVPEVPDIPTPTRAIEDQPKEGGTMGSDVQARLALPIEVSLMDCVAYAYKPVPEVRSFLEVAGDEAGLRRALTRIVLAGGIAADSPLDFALAVVWQYSRADDESRC